MRKKISSSIDLGTFTKNGITDRSIRLLVQESTRYTHNAATPTSPVPRMLQECNRGTRLVKPANWNVKQMRLCLFQYFIG